MKPFSICLNFQSNYKQLIYLLNVSLVCRINMKGKFMLKHINMCIENVLFLYTGANVCWLVLYVSS